MGTVDNKSVSRRLIDEVFNRGKLDLVDELLDEDFTVHVSGGATDRDAFKEMVAAYRTGFPDYQCTIHDQIAEGDQVVTRWTFRGTQAGQLMGIPPTGKRVTVTGIAIDRVAGGKVVESWLELDVNRMPQDLGIAPPPQGAPGL